MVLRLSGPKTYSERLYAGTGAICVNRGLVPRYAPYGTYTIGVTVSDHVGNTTQYTGAELGTASISNAP